MEDPEGAMLGVLPQDGPTLSLEFHVWTLLFAQKLA